MIKDRNHGSSRYLKPCLHQTVKIKIEEPPKVMPSRFSEEGIQAQRQWLSPSWVHLMTGYPLASEIYSCLSCINQIKVLRSTAAQTSAVWVLLLLVGFCYGAVIVITSKQCSFEGTCPYGAVTGVLLSLSSFRERPFWRWCRLSSTTNNPSVPPPCLLHRAETHNRPILNRRQ